MHKSVYVPWLHFLLLIHFSLLIFCSIFCLFVCNFSACVSPCPCLPPSVCISRFYVPFALVSSFSRFCFSSLAPGCERYSAILKRQEADGTFTPVDPTEQLLGGDEQKDKFRLFAVPPETGSNRRLLVSLDVYVALSPLSLSREVIILTFCPPHLSHSSSFSSLPFLPPFALSNHFHAFSWRVSFVCVTCLLDCVSFSSVTEFTWIDFISLGVFIC